MSYKKMCKRCEKYFIPTSQTVTLCDNCWQNAKKKAKGKKMEKLINNG